MSGGYQAVRRARQALMPPVLPSRVAKARRGPLIAGLVVGLVLYRAADQPRDGGRRHHARPSAAMPAFIWPL